MFSKLVHLEEDSDGRLIDSKLTPSQSRQQCTPLPLTLGVESTSFQFRRLEHFLERVRPCADGNASEMVVTLYTEGWAGPEDDEVEASIVEEGEEVLMEGARNRRELGGEGDMSKRRVGLKNRSE